MSRKNKRIERLLSKPRDYTFDELRALLNSLGYVENNKGKTSGSRVQFIRADRPYLLLLHCPHNPPIVKSYMIDNIIDYLKESGDLDE